MDILHFYEEHVDALKELLFELARIPAPSHQERRRAEFILAVLHAHGLHGAYIDEADNVIVEIGNVEAGAVLIMAHTDIVFSKDVALEVIRRDGKLYCPGIGDDTVHVAMLVYCCLYAATHFKESGQSFIFAFNSCEEGEGNLKGCKQIMARYSKFIREMITFDGYLDVINDSAVGSMRYRIKARCHGGHSFRDFGNDNAIAIIAKLITYLDHVQLPKGGITTYNFGKINGGSTVNSIAEECEVLYEFRSDDADSLLYMKEFFEGVIGEFPECVSWECIGVRPCACGVDKDRQNALLERVESVFSELPMPSRYPASTDCNIPLSLGIPSVCVGFISGGGAHTINEYIDEDSIGVGFFTALKLIKSYCKNSDRE
ncbi:MAG: M20/M25/M40 family metallo-hydrolase [Clostridia bacterium]|nr:M20/M25/M40 family metallo-hydrolase [Clostridia bacterium]